MSAGMTWMVLIGVFIGLWILSGMVIKAVGFVLRLILRLVVVAILLGLLLYGYQTYTGKRFVTTEWKG